MRVAWVLLICLFCSCASSVTTSNTPTDWLVDLASEKIGEDPSIEKNQSQSFALCWRNFTNPSNNMPIVNFVVVRMADHRVVEQGSVTMGSVNWKTDYQVEISTAPGQIELERGVNATTRTIDLTKYLDMISK